MTYTFKLSRRIARLRAPVLAILVLALALVACSDDTLAPAEGNDAALQPATPSGGPVLAASFVGGIPIGTTAQPNTEFGARYNGALRNIHPQYLNRDLSDIKSRGGKVVLMMAGPQWLYQDAAGHFSLTKWKERIDRYSDVNFDAYIKDGTLIGHYLIDEPNDPANWNGQTISGETLDEMARYSKAKWPGLPTIIRAYPSYLEKWAPYRYVDAAWAQYVDRMGDPAKFIADNVASAKRQGLALVVGLNLIKGGPSKTELTAAQVKSVGAALLASSYPCAFISWQYDDRYLASGSVQDAMDYLRQQAEGHASKSCSASAASGTPEPPPPPPSNPPPSNPPPGPNPPPPSSVDRPLPFGMFQAPLGEYTSRWTGALYRADPAHVLPQLAKAETAKLGIIVALTSTARSKNADGTFSLTKWKAQVDAYRGLALDRYVSSRTLYAHFLVAQPNCASCWGGRAISWETVEEMARYSKSVWPSLVTTVRAAPSALAGASFRWSSLDAGWAQYTLRRGDAKAFVAAEASAAKAEGLGLIVGVTLLQSAGESSQPMTAAQVKQVGTAIAKDASVCALVAWKYDASYVGRSDIREALDSVAAVAKSRTAAACAAS